MEPLKIGNITLPHRAVFGPMAGFTDAPCRRLMAQHGAGFTVSEMVSSRALVYGDHKTVNLLKAEPNGAPYGVQIFGEVPEIMGEATAAIEQYEFDFVDINMGCPAPKIVSGGAGSKLMLDPDRCGRIVEQVVAHTKRPVTVGTIFDTDADEAGTNTLFPDTVVTATLTAANVILEKDDELGVMFVEDGAATLPAGRLHGEATYL